jgi:DNA primase
VAEHFDLEEIRARLANPHDVARRLGLLEGSRRQAHGLLVRCPAHADRTASCSLTTGPDGTLRVRCFACDLAGAIFDLLAAVEGLDRGRDFHELVKRAAELASLDPEGCTPRVSLPRRVPAPREDPPLPEETFAAVIAPLLHIGRLDAGAVAADVCGYLARRGLLEAARADGWAALPVPEFQPSWSAMLLDAAEPVAGYAPPFSAEDVRRSGLLARDGFAHPENRLCIPWRDPAGRVVNLQRRRLDAGEPRYAGARGRGFAWPYGIERIAHASDETPLAFCEGAIDVLALRAACAARGDSAVVLGVPGISGWRASWAALARGRAAIVAFDADDAGDRVVARLAAELADAGALCVERWRPPGAKDWAEAWVAGAIERVAA